MHYIQLYLNIMHAYFLKDSFILHINIFLNFSAFLTLLISEFHNCSCPFYSHFNVLFHGIVIEERCK